MKFSIFFQNKRKKLYVVDTLKAIVESSLYAKIKLSTSRMFECRNHVETHIPGFIHKCPHCSKTRHSYSISEFYAFVPPEQISLSFLLFAA